MLCSFVLSGNFLEILSVMCWGMKPRLAAFVVGSTFLDGGSGLSWLYSHEGASSSMYVYHTDSMVLSLSTLSCAHIGHSQKRWVLVSGRLCSQKGQEGCGYLRRSLSL